MVQEQETRRWGSRETRPSDPEAEVAELRAENERLKKLVVELTAIIARSVVDRK